MGGRGSGRWRGYRRKGAVEETERLDVHALLRRGCLESPAAGVLDTGHHYLTVEAGLLLWGRWPYFLQKVPLVWEFYPFRRPRFLCACGRKVRFLYADRPQFACQACAKLNWRCQQVAPAERKKLKLKKLLARMGYPNHYHIQFVTPLPPRRRRGQPWRHPWTWGRMARR
jgi:hypothetical protein